MKEKKYEGSVYVGVVGPDIEYGECRDSIMNVERRPGDGLITYARATKGYEARQLHINNFIESGHDFILFLDSDMKYQPDTLMRLRSYGKPFVSGFYMRRQVNPMGPVWFRPWSGKWPYEPWIGVPEPGKLHYIGASGWGCMLIHREVILAVRGMLHGEQEVAEDDMDVWPYDLAEIVQAIRALDALAEDPPVKANLIPAMKYHVAMLNRQIRPLRADTEIIGSDIRFPFYALSCGYKLYGDPDVCPSHSLNFPLGLADYAATYTPELQKAMYDDLHKRIQKDRNQLWHRLQELRGGQ